MRLYDSTLPDGSRRLIIHLDERKRITKGDPRVELGELRAGDPDPDWCVEQVFGHDPDPSWTGDTEQDPALASSLPMRPRTAEEIAEQQEREAVAIAREELARRRAEEQQARALAADPFADGGRRV